MSHRDRPSRPARWALALLVCAVLGIAVRSPLQAHIPITTTVEFNREVIRILERRCLQCHVDGGVAMSLATYDEARPWAEAIKEEVLGHRMPPWRGVRGYGHFLNDNSLSDHEVAFLVSWAAGGAPEGETELQPFRPAHTDHRSGADLVLAAEPVDVAAYEEPFERDLILSSGTTQDLWLDRVQWDPGEPGVVESAFVFIEPSGQWIGSWTPWAEHSVQPAEGTYLLPAGASLRVQVRYRGGETARVDTGALVLGFAERGQALIRQLEVVGIPDPVRGSEVLRGEIALLTETQVFALRPEISAAARSLEVRALEPDGASRVLLWMLADRADSQSGYVLAEPTLLPAGTRLLLAVHYDEARVGEQARVLLSAY